MAVVTQHSQVAIIALSPGISSYILQYCPLVDFGRKQFHCSMSYDLEVANKTGKKFPPI